MSRDKIAKIKFFGHKLRTLRTRQELTVRQLSDQIGITNSYISRLENGQHKPTLEVAYTIAQYFNVSLDDLANDDLELE